MAKIPPVEVEVQLNVSKAVEAIRKSGLPAEFDVAVTAAEIARASKEELEGQMGALQAAVEEIFVPLGYRVERFDDPEGAKLVWRCRKVAQERWRGGMNKRRIHQMAERDRRLTQLRMMRPDLDERTIVDEAQKIAYTCPGRIIDVLAESIDLAREGKPLPWEKVGPVEAEVKMVGWVAVKDRVPPMDEPVVYCRPNPRGGWHVGIAYWTVSQKWHPEMESSQAPEGFTHWLPLPGPPA